MNRISDQRTASPLSLKANSFIRRLRLAAAALLLLVAFPVVALAQLTNISYTTSSDGNGGLIITGFGAAGSGGLSIPSTLLDPNTQTYLPVTSIGSGAFVQKSVTSVTFPNSVTTIGPNAFDQCGGLTSVTLPVGLTSIGSGAFLLCGLTSVTIPPSVTSIGSQAFQSDPLTGVIIPDSVTSIGYNAFNSCYALASVTIGSGVTSIGLDAFALCSLTSITVSAQNSSFSSVTGVLFDKTQSTLIQYPTASASYTIPNTVTSISDEAFDGCTTLTSVTFPASLTTIGNNVFYGCANLTGATLPNSVTSIGQETFWQCSNLASVTLPNSITSIPGGMFLDCSSLANVTIPNTVTLIDNSAFYGCSSLTGIAIPNSVTTIGSQTFESCTRLTGVILPNGLTNIGNAAFSQTAMTSITIPGSLSAYGSIGYDAFDFSPLTSVTISNGVTALSAAMFNGCASLTTVTIPGSVVSMGNGVFQGCTGLTTAIFLGNAPTLIGSAPFDNAVIGFQIEYYAGATGFTSPTWDDGSGDTYATVALDPFGGTAQGGGWYYSAWFGYYNTTYYPWINDASLGFLYISTSDNINLYAYVLNGSPGSMGWLYTTQAQFPNVYSFSRGSWLYYSGGTSFYNYTTQTTETY